MQTPFLTKLGTNKNLPKSRVWIEGSRLVSNGFTVGARYNRTIGDTGNLILALSPEGKYKVSGKGDKPIIDVTGAIITERFTGSHVQVDFVSGVIVISNPAVQMQIAA